MRERRSENMNADEFVEDIRLTVYRSAIDGTLRQLARPAGRKPRPDVAELSAWFNTLTPEDRERVAALVRRAVYQAIFGVMTALDGVKVIDDAGTEFYLRTGDGTLLNEGHDLHELFQISVDHELGYVDEYGNPFSEH